MWCSFCNMQMWLVLKIIPKWKLWEQYIFPITCLSDTKEIGKNSHRNKKSSAILLLLSAMQCYSLSYSRTFYEFLPPSPKHLVFISEYLFPAFLFVQRELPPSPGQGKENNEIPPPSHEQLYNTPLPGSRDFQCESPRIWCRPFWYNYCTSYSSDHSEKKGMLHSS